MVLPTPAIQPSLHVQYEVAGKLCEIITVAVAVVIEHHVIGGAELVDAIDETNVLDTLVLTGVEMTEELLDTTDQEELLDVALVVAVEGVEVAGDDVRAENSLDTVVNVFVAFDVPVVPVVKVILGCEASGQANTLVPSGR